MLKKVLVASALALLACGCSTSPKYCPYCGADLSKAPEKSATQPASGQAVAGAPIVPVAVNTATSNLYPVGASKLFEQAQVALKADGFTIDSAKDGIIQTGWKSYEGEFHVFRRWEEQSRFRVTAIPDINNPTGSSRLDIVEETQRRSNPKASWEAASSRPERAAQVMAAIQNYLKGK